MGVKKEITIRNVITGEEKHFSTYTEASKFLGVERRDIANNIGLKVRGWLIGEKAEWVQVYIGKRTWLTVRKGFEDYDVDEWKKRYRENRGVDFI